MATYTQNYALHQWEDTDDFLRSDFNADFLKLDTALASQKSEYQSGIANNAYNIYNMLLQNYYEGKYTGYKQGLLFDGFTDTTTATLSESVVQFNNTIALYASGQTSSEWSDSSNYSAFSNSMYSRTLTVTAPGILMGYSFFLYSGVSGGSSSISCLYNNETTETGTIYYANASGGELTYWLTTPIYLYPGDTVRFMMAEGTSSMRYYGSNAYTLSGRMEVTPVEGASGTLTQSCDLGSDWSESHLWVRYGGGNLTPTLGDSSMTLVETYATQTLDGTDCTEGYWTACAGSDGDDLILALSLGEDENMTLYDYGILFR